MERFPVRRNTILLAATLTSLSGMVQLAVAVGTVTLVLVTDIEGILGLGPAIFLTAGALAALPAGRLMDRYGRVPVLAGGCLAGIAGCLTTSLGCALDTATLVIPGFALVGIAQGTILLARAAAADMYPPERRARGISYVLFGALFGAALGPLVFRPLFAGKELDTDALVVPWIAAAGIMVVGLVLVLCVRPDPRTIAQQMHFDAGGSGFEEAAPLSEILRRPGVLTALVAAVASFAGMVSVMNLAGYLVIDHGHHQSDVFTVISLHIVGMYALVLVIGQLVDSRRAPAVPGRGPAPDGLVHARARLVRERLLDVGLALPARARLEHLLRRRGRRPRRPGLDRRAREADRPHRSALELHRCCPRAARRRRLQRVRRRGAGARRDGLRGPARGLDSATIRRRRTRCAPSFCEMKTYSAKPGEIARDWYVVDAEGKTLGRLATQIADTLRGKNKPTYTPHVDTGDFVIVVNAEKIAVTGQKLDQKMYHRHSGYPGGLRSRTLREQLERRPTEVLRKAVKGMLPRNRLARRQITKLKIYAGPVHPHEAQAPKTLEVS